MRWVAAILRDETGDTKEYIDSIKDPGLKSVASQYAELSHIDEVNMGEVEAQVASVSDPTIKALGVQKTDLSYALEITTAWMAPQESQAYLAAITNPEVKAMAQKLYDFSLAEHIGALIQDDISEIVPAVAAIQDPVAKSWAQRTLDYELADVARNPYMEEARTQQALNAIVDPAIKSAAQSNYRNAAGYTVSAELDNQRYSVSQPVFGTSEVMTELQEAKNAVDQQIQDQKTALSDTLDSMVRMQLAQKVSKASVPLELPKPAFDPLEVVAPKVELSRDQLDDLILAGIGERGQNEAVESSLAFAEIAASEEGVVELAFPEDDMLDSQTKEQLTQIFNDLNPFIAAAFKNGSLSRIRFTLGVYSPYYSNLSREVVIQIPQDKDSQVSMDQIYSGVLHEVVHALSRGKTRGETLSEAEFQQFATVCNSLSEDAHDEFDYSLIDKADKFDAFKDYLPEEQWAVVDFVKQAINDLDIEQLIVSNDSYYEGTTMPYQCEVPASITRILKRAALKLNLDFTLDEETAFKDTDIIELQGLWTLAVRQYSLYAQLNEANFVKTDDPVKELLGHTEDGASELISSLAVASLVYKNEFVAAATKLNEEDKQTVVAAVRAMVDILVADNPQLLSILSEMEAEVVSGITQG